MNSNWENFLKNRGEWHGTFTQVAPTGELLDSVPSILTIAALEGDRLALFRVRRFGAGGYSEPPIAETQQELRTIGNQSIFFDTGAFSKGTMQLAPFAEFITEYGFIAENRRLRFVQLFDTEHYFTKLVLIREFRHQTAASERQPLTAAQLLGVWQGEAVTAYADLSNPEIHQTRLEIQQIDTDRLAETYAWGNHKTTAIATIRPNQLYFGEEKPARTVLLLPDGGSSHVPNQIQRHQPFSVEVGWLINDHERQRLIRSYNHKGEWVSSTHVIEYKISN